MVQTQYFDNPFTIILSFHKLIEKYVNIARNGEGLSKKIAKTLVKEVSVHPELKDGITDSSQIADHAALISRLVAELFPVLLTKNEIKAITIPYQGFIFNHTERLHDILQDAGPDFDMNIRGFDADQFYIFSCGIILNRYYGTRLDFNKPLFYEIPAANGLLKYYRILYNDDFIEIFPVVKAPEFSAIEIRQLLDSYNNISLWKEKFPPGSWVMKGFTIMTLVDVTIENAVSVLKDNLLVKHSGADLQQILSSICRSIFQINDIRVGLSIYQQDTGKITDMGFGQKIRSFILSGKKEDDLKYVISGNSYEVLIQKQSYFVIADVDEYIAANSCTELVRTSKIQHFRSLIIAPVVKNNVLIGFIELVSTRSGEFNSVNAFKLSLVLPFLADALDAKIREFQNVVSAVIQNNYTTLHASVNWKFEREAKNYINARAGGLDYSIKEIRFRKVFPFYGQIDIRNSSLRRNLSVTSDLKNQLNQTIIIIELLNKDGLIENASRQLGVLKAFLIDMSAGIKAYTEQNISQYLESNIFPLFRSTYKLKNSLTKRIDEYFKQSDSLTGKYYAARRNYETTLTLVNDKLLTILDKRQAEIQLMFPHYYERFKTDGVEHNLYIGPEITPYKEFKKVDLQRLRLWQLLVTTEMEVAQFRLKSILPYHLSVTTLILVFNTPIDIRFRMDEKHFDIDGAYNIRYEVIKKRIDKAYIKGTEERITHAGKLTIVYSKEEEENEYLGYLGLLQQAGILKNKIQKIEVEDLQGVSGLKALRASIRYDEKMLLRYDMLYEELYEKLI